MRRKGMSIGSWCRRHPVSSHWRARRNGWRWTARFSANLRRENRQPGETSGQVGFFSCAVDRRFAGDGKQGTVRVWRTSDWTEAYSVPDQKAPVAFSPDGQRWQPLRSTGSRLLKVPTGKIVGEIPLGMPPFSFSPRGDVIAVDSTNGIVLWDLDAGRALRRSNILTGCSTPLAAGHE